MKVDRPSKNLMTTLPATASVTTTSARWLARSRPSTLPTKRSVEASSSSVARWIRASPLPFSSPMRQQRDPRVVDAQHLLGEDRAHPRVLGEVLGGRVGVGADVEQDDRSRLGRHLDREARTVDAGQAAEPQDRRGHPGPGVAGGDDRVRLSVPDEVGRDDDEGPSSRAGRGPGARPCRRPAPAWTMRRSAGSVARDARDDGLSPTRITWSAGWARAYSSTPGTTSVGPWSPPIASKATRTPPGAASVRRTEAGHGISAGCRRRCRRA